MLLKKNVLCGLHSTDPHPALPMESLQHASGCPWMKIMEKGKFKNSSMKSKSRSSLSNQKESSAYHSSAMPSYFRNPSPTLLNKLLNHLLQLLINGELSQNNSSPQIWGWALHQRLSPQSWKRICGSSYFWILDKCTNFLKVWGNSKFLCICYLSLQLQS